MTAIHIIQLSRLFDAFRPLSPAEREALLADLPQSQRVYIPSLREMLLQLDRMDEQPLLHTLPQLNAPTVDLAREGDLVGPYRLLHPLGRGGMSEVWLAERADEGVKRQVAVKLPLLTLNTQQQLERFVRERDVLATLEHPHIARLYDAGVTPAGQPYLVLEHIDGLPLTRYCDEHKLGVAARLGLFLQVLAAVEYAHSHLVVHRDLKPSNILVDAQGQVKLLDFGIAKLLPTPDTESSYLQTTQNGGWALTLLYAAPEQIKNRPISTSADVYALGVVLFELLTGEWPYALRVQHCRRDPFLMSDLMHAVLHDEPAHLSEVVTQEKTVQRWGCASLKNLRDELQGDLNIIALKALRKLPEQRYRSAESFADDLQRFLNHQPIAARPPSWIYRARLFTRRHRGTSLGASIGVVAAIIFGSLAWQQHQQSIEYQERASTIHSFMLDLVNDAEPDENQSEAPVTAKQLVDGAVKRARRTFSDKPRLKGELLNELGYMYGHIGDPAAAKALRDEGLALLEANAPNADPALNKARAYRAITLVRQEGRDKLERGRALAQVVIDRCRSDDVECAKARFFALGALATVDEKLGHCGKSLINRQQALHEARLGFGRTHTETLQSLTDFSIAARNAGRYLEAQEALEELLAITFNRTLRAGLRTSISILKARLDIDLGRYELAESSLRELLKTDANSSRSPIDTGWSYYANGQMVLKSGLLSEALYAQGDLQGAKQAAERAITLIGSTQAKAESGEALRSLARTMGLMGKPVIALSRVQLLINKLPVSSSNSICMLQLHLIRGELLARAGELLSARKELEDVSNKVPLVKPDVHFVLLAKALDQLGCVLRALGKPDQALSRHVKARSLMRKVLPAEHPLLARNALYMAVARMEAAKGGGLEPVLRQATHYKSLFPAESVWRQIVDSYLDASCTPTSQQPECLMLL
jgi:eukaryotic-like serine/threonine-protein kinase